MKIIGISVQTTNKDWKSAEDIGALWTRFYSENIFDKISNKLSSDIFAIYTDYESDYRGKYTTIIGCEVTEITEVLEGYITREFPKEKFKTFIAKGSMPQAVVEVWTDIWANDALLNRKYTYDFKNIVKNHNKVKTQR